MDGQTRRIDSKMIQLNGMMLMEMGMGTILVEQILTPVQRFGVTQPKVELLDVQIPMVTVIDQIDALPLDDTQYSDVDGDGYGDSQDGNSS